MLQSRRLLLRHWQAQDAEALYRLASDPAIGPRAGWPVHDSLQTSQNIIATVFDDRHTFAICNRATQQVIGSVGLKPCRDFYPHQGLSMELGYWVGQAYWGQGYALEAGQVILDYGFKDLSLDQIWCGYANGNHQSQRVQEKLGFQNHLAYPNIDRPLLGDKVTEYYSRILRQDWTPLRQS